MTQQQAEAYLTHRNYRLCHCNVCGAVIKIYTVICGACLDWYGNVLESFKR